MNRNRLIMGCLVALMILPANAVLAMDMISEGVYRVNFERVDDLLELNATPGIRLLLLDDGTKPKLVSDSHIKVLRNWVEAGGVLWVAGDGLDSSLAKEIAPYRVGNFGYKKSSNDKRGGELIVKGVTPRLVIEDHPLTEGVSQLYLFPRHRFDGTRNALPLVRMSDTRGNTGLVMAAIPLGRGLVVLDGTARKQRMYFFGHTPGFKEIHPNSVKQDGTWNSYDWEKLVSNAGSYVQDTAAPIQAAVSH